MFDIEATLSKNNNEIHSNILHLNNYTQGEENECTGFTKQRKHFCIIYCIFSFKFYNVLKMI
jgi:hypothetical protein